MMKSHFFLGTRNIKVVSFRFRFYPKRSSFFGKSFFWDICVYLIFIIWYGLIYPSISPVGYITPSPIQPNLTSDHHMSMKTKRIFWDLPKKKRLVGSFGIFWDLPEKKRLLKKEDIYVSGNVWERKEEMKVKETETSRKYPKFRERKSRFHYLCPHLVFSSFSFFTGC